MTVVQRLVVGAAAIVACAFAAAMLVLPAIGSPAVGAVSNWTQIVVPVLTAVVCLDSARRQRDRRQRRAWTLYGIGAFSWGVGQCVFTWYELVAQVVVPVPSVADAAFILYPVLGTAAIWLLPLVPRSRTVNVRSLLDGLVVASSLVFVVWALSLRLLWAAGDGDVASLVVTTTYVVTDMVLLTMVALLLPDVGRARRRVLVPVALGTACFAVADIGYVVVTSATSYSSGEAFDVGWVLGFLGVAVAAAMAHPTRGCAARAGHARDVGPALVGHDPAAVRAGPRRGRGAAVAARVRVALDRCGVRPGRRGRRPGAGRASWWRSPTTARCSPRSRASTRRPGTTRCTTPSPAWPTARCSSTGSATRSTGPSAPADAPPCCSATSTASSRSTTCTATPPGTPCWSRSPSGCQQQVRTVDCVARLGRRRVRRAAGGPERPRDGRGPDRGRDDRAGAGRRREVRVRTSVGVAHAHGAGEGTDQLVSDADHAMYRVKQANKRGRVPATHPAALLPHQAGASGGRPTRRHRQPAPGGPGAAPPGLRPPGAAGSARWMMRR